MNIWIFNPFDDIPGEGPKLRYWTLSECLSRQGHDVIWWSADFSHRRKASRRSDIEVRSSEMWERSDSSRVRENVDRSSVIGGFTVQLVPVRAYAKNISLKRMLSHRDYGRNLMRLAKEAVESGRLERPDCIVASTPPLEGGKAALELKKHFGCRVVIDVMDAWPDTFYRAMPKGRWFFFLYERLANRLMREADAVSAQSQAFADWAKRRGYAGEPHVVYLGSEIGVRSSDIEDGGSEMGELSDRSRVRKNVERISEIGDRSSDIGEGEEESGNVARSFSERSVTTRPITFLYLGSMGAVYDLETVIAAAADLKSKGLVFRIELAGGGEKEAMLKVRVKELGLEDTVHFHGYLQGKDLDCFLAEGDVGLCPMFPDSQVAVPYKACEYAGAGLPIINSLPGELAALLFRYQAGRFYQAGDVSSLSTAMEAYIKTPDQLPAARKAALQLARDLFDRKKTYPRWAEWISRLKL